MISVMDFHQTKMKLLLNQKGAQVRYLLVLMIVQAVQIILKQVEVITVENSGQFYLRTGPGSHVPTIEFDAVIYSSLFEGFLIKYLVRKKSFIRQKFQTQNENGNELFNLKKIFLLIP